MPRSISNDQVYGHDEDSDVSMDRAATGIRKARRRANEVPQGDDQKRQTFSKRKKGLVLKAAQLSLLTNSKIFIFMSNDKGHSWAYSTPAFEEAANDEHLLATMRKLAGIPHTVGRAPAHTEVMEHPSEVGPMPQQMNPTRASQRLRNRKHQRRTWQQHDHDDALNDDLSEETAAEPPAAKAAGVGSKRKAAAASNESEADVADVADVAAAAELPDAPQHHSKRKPGRARKPAKQQQATDQQQRSKHAPPGKHFDNLPTSPPQYAAAAAAAAAPPIDAGFVTPPPYSHMLQPGYCPPYPPHFPHHMPLPACYAPPPAAAAAAAGGFWPPPYAAARSYRQPVPLPFPYLPPSWPPAAAVPVPRSASNIPCEGEGKQLQQLLQEQEQEQAQQQRREEEAVTSKMKGADDQEV